MTLDQHGTTIRLEPWRIEGRKNGAILIWITTGYTHIICGLN